MPDKDSDALIQKGIAAIEDGNTLVALLHFEKAARLEPSPVALSYLGYCLARENRQMQKALSLCTNALQADPHKPLYYLNLGRVYLLSGEKGKAIKTFRKGLKQGRSPQIIEELKALGLRGTPTILALSRNNPLNKYLGLLMEKLGLR